VEKILSHHVEKIEFLIKKGIYRDIVSAERWVRQMELPLMKSLVDDSGNMWYPLLQAEEEREKTVAVMMKAIAAVMKGEFEEISEWNPGTGKRQFDCICNGCGNKINEVCILDDVDGLSLINIVNNK
jgi:hypothetical protein